MIRLDKFFSMQNIATRKDIGVMIRKGRVEIDGVVVKNSAMKIDENTAKVKLDGKEISYNKFVYIMMNKPKGILSATRDKNASTVLDIIPEELQRKELFPAGRLDKDTTGLLIITDDGDLAHRMLAPKSHVYKRYKATIDMDIEKSDIKKFADGIVSGENHFLPAVLEQDEKEKNVGYVTIREGKFHQVKRMFVACGKKVVELQRLSIGELCLDKKLEQGQCRAITDEEVLKIFE
ncbi:MAG: pseudouridine synthase [Clostridia bacterium]